MFSLPRIYKTPMGLRHGLFGRNMCGYQAMRALGSPPGGSDSLKTRFTPNVADGDVYITTIYTSKLYRVQLRQNGTYLYDAVGDSSSQLIGADKYDVTNQTLYGEGLLAVNNKPPIIDTVSGKLFPSLLSIGQPVDFFLRAHDPEGNGITFAVQSGTFIPGCSLSAAGEVTGTPNAYGSVGFTIRIEDPFGAFTDSAEIVTVQALLLDYTGQQYAAAQAQIAALGGTASKTQVASSLPTDEIISQSLPPNTPVTGSFSINFTVSNGALFISNPDLFPTAIGGITFESTRTVEWSTTVQQTLTGKVSTIARMRYPQIHWDLNYEYLDRTLALDELKQIEALFKAKQGANATFLYLDPDFNQVTAEPFGTGDGSTKQFQLVATYGAGGFGTPEMVQQLQAPPTIYDNGVAVSTSAYGIGPTGIVTFNSAPATGHALTWTGGFYYLVMFELDQLSPSQFLQNFWQLQSLKLKNIIV